MFHGVFGLKRDRVSANIFVTVTVLCYLTNSWIFGEYTSKYKYSLRSDKSIRREYGLENDSRRKWRKLSEESCEQVRLQRSNVIFHDTRHSNLVRSKRQLEGFLPEDAPSNTSTTDLYHNCEWINLAPYWTYAKNSTRKYNKTTPTTHKPTFTARKNVSGLYWNKIKLAHLWFSQEDTTLDNASFWKKYYDPKGYHGQITHPIYGRYGTRFQSPWPLTKPKRPTAVRLVTFTRGTMTFRFSTVFFDPRINSTLSLPKTVPYEESSSEMDNSSFWQKYYDPKGYHGQITHPIYGRYGSRFLSPWPLTKEPTDSGIYLATLTREPNSTFGFEIFKPLTITPFNPNSPSTVSNDDDTKWPHGVRVMEFTRGTTNQPEHQSTEKKRFRRAVFSEEFQTARNFKGDIPLGFKDDERNVQPNLCDFIRPYDTRIVYRKRKSKKNQSDESYERTEQISTYKHRLIVKKAIPSYKWRDRRRTARIEEISSTIPIPEISDIVLNKIPARKKTNIRKLIDDFGDKIIPVIEQAINNNDTDVLNLFWKRKSKQRQMDLAKLLQSNSTSSFIIRDTNLSNFHTEKLTHRPSQAFIQGDNEWKNKFSQKFTLFEQNSRLEDKTGFRNDRQSIRNLIHDKKILTDNRRSAIDHTIPDIQHGAEKCEKLISITLKYIREVEKSSKKKTPYMTTEYGATLIKSSSEHEHNMQQDESIGKEKQSKRSNLIPDQTLLPYTHKICDLRFNNDQDPTIFFNFPTQNGIWKDRLRNEIRCKRSIFYESQDNFIEHFHMKKYSLEHHVSYKSHIFYSPATCTSPEIFFGLAKKDELIQLTNKTRSKRAALRDQYDLCMTTDIIEEDASSNISTTEHPYMKLYSLEKRHLSYRLPIFKYPTTGISLGTFYTGEYLDLSDVERIFGTVTGRSTYTPDSVERAWSAINFSDEVRMSDESYGYMPEITTILDFSHELRKKANKTRKVTK